MKKSLLVVLIAIFLISFKTTVAIAPEREVKDYSVKELISHYAKLYGASENELMTVAKCESNFRPHVYGDGIKAFGVYQFHEPTFKWFSQMMGEELDYYSYHDNIKLASWVFAKYPKYKTHWTCFTKFYL